MNYVVSMFQCRLLNIGDQWSHKNWIKTSDPKVFALILKKKMVAVKPSNFVDTLSTIKTSWRTQVASDFRFKESKYRSIRFENWTVKTASKEEGALQTHQQIESNEWRRKNAVLDETWQFSVYFTVHRSTYECWTAMENVKSHFICCLVCIMTL